jgi:hypothetical protein
MGQHLDGVLQTGVVQPLDGLWTSIVRLLNTMHTCTALPQRPAQSQNQSGPMTDRDTWLGVKRSSYAKQTSAVGSVSTRILSTSLRFCLSMTTSSSKSWMSTSTSTSSSCLNKLRSSVSLFPTTSTGIVVNSCRSLPKSWLKRQWSTTTISSGLSKLLNDNLRRHNRLYIRVVLQVATRSLK